MMVTLSTVEAKYVAATEAGREVVWICIIVGEVGEAMKQEVILFGDNTGSIAIAKNPEFH